jgi:hypothetical protein
MRQTTIRVRGLRSAGVILVLTGLMAALAMPVAAQETLAGETFTGDPGVQDSIVDCTDGDGFMFAMGRATGPVPGDFLESVDYAFDPATGALTSFEAEFTIHDSETNELLATGTKSLIAGETECNAVTERTVTTASVSYSVDFDGDALVDEQGTASVTLVDDGPSGILDAFVEVFGAGDAEATSKNQCKKGGWRDRTRADGSPFRNQGECIHYVNTGE